MSDFRRTYKGFLVSDTSKGLCLALDQNRIEESIEFMKSESIFCLEINYALGFYKENISFLQQFDFIKHLLFTQVLVKDISPIHYLVNLETLLLDKEGKMPIDFSCFPYLKKCSFSWRPKAESLFRFGTQLEQLRIYKFKQKDLTKLENLINLKTFEIINSPIYSLAGIERFEKLEMLGLYYLRNLTSIDGLQQLKHLQELIIESCNRITDIQPIKDITELTCLRLLKQNNISSIKPVENLTNLKTFVLGASKVVDGDMNPLLKLKKLSYVLFAPRKHYTHKQEEINLLN